MHSSHASALILHTANPQWIVYCSDGLPPRSDSARWRSSDIVGLRHRITPEDGAYHDSPTALQVTPPPACSVDSCAALPGPLLDCLLGVITGQVTLGKHPPDNGADAISRLPVERPAANISVHAEKSGSLVSELPILVVEATC